MINAPRELNDSSRQATWLNDLLRFCKSLRIVPSPGVRVKQGTQGTELHIRAPGGGTPGTPSSLQRMQIATSIFPYDHFEAFPIDAAGDATGSNVKVAKPPLLRRSPFDPDATPPGVGSLSEYSTPGMIADGELRNFTIAWLDPDAFENQGKDVSQWRALTLLHPTATDLVFQQVVWPSYRVNQVIFATDPDGGTGVEDPDDPGTYITWQDMNVDGRHWHWLERRFQVCVNNALADVLLLGGEPQ